MIRNLSWTLSIGLISTLVMAGESDPELYLSGQVHPTVEIRVLLNGQEVKEVPADGEKAQVFVRQLDASLLSETNELVVVHRVAAPAPEKPPPTSRTFRVKLSTQEDPSDSSTAVELVEIRGPKLPIEDAESPHIEKATFAGS